MIDCHAHAYPTLGDRLSQISPHAADVARGVRDRVKARLGRLPFAGAIAGAAKSALDATAFMDVEGLAALRKKSALAKEHESILAMAALPQLVASGSIAKLYESMVRNGIEKTVLIAAEPIASNEWVLAEARDSGGRLVPVVNVPAMRDDATDAQWHDAFEELASDGARGFKLHLNMDGLGHAHRGYRAMFEVAKRRGLFVIIHTGCFHIAGYKIPDDAEPSLFTPLFEDFRSVRVCLAHMNRDAPEKAWDVMKRFESVWADTSWQPRENVERAVNEVGSDRIVLGSDFPLLHGDLQGDVARVLGDAVDEDVIEKIGTTNARALIGD